MSERKTERRSRPTSTWKRREEGSGRATGVRKTIGKLPSRTKESHKKKKEPRITPSKETGTVVATRPVGSARQARMEEAFQFDEPRYG